METRDKQRHNTPDALRKVGGRSVQSGIATHHHDGIANGDLSEANGTYRSPQRGKTVTSAGGARSDGGARNTGILAERIREERDNNPYRRERGEVEDKDRQDRHRSTRRDVEEEANRSWIVAGKRSRGGDAMEDAMAEEKAGERGNPARVPYQYPRGRERETRSTDKNAGIGRSDRVEEKSAPIELSKPAKRLELERDGNGRRDRHENEEQQPSTRRDRKKARTDKNEEEGTSSLSENKQTRAGSRRTMNSLDDAEKGRFVVNEEEKLPASDERRRDASNDGRYNPEEVKKWRVSNSMCV